jgi:TPR repeat protein
MYSKGQGVPQDYDEALKRAAFVAGRIVSGIGG